MKGERVVHGSKGNTCNNTSMKEMITTPKDCWLGKQDVVRSLCCTCTTTLLLQLREGPKMVSHPMKGLLPVAIVTLQSLALWRPVTLLQSAIAIAYICVLTTCTPYLNDSSR